MTRGYRCTRVQDGQTFTYEITGVDGGYVSFKMFHGDRAQVMARGEVPLAFFDDATPAPPVEVAA